MYGSSSDVAAPTVITIAYWQLMMMSGKCPSLSSSSSFGKAPHVTSDNDEGHRERSWVKDDDDDDGSDDLVGWLGYTAVVVTITTE